MIGVDVKATKVQQRLAKLALQIKDRRPINRKVSIALYAKVIRGFQTEGVAITGGRWAALAPATKRWKAKRGYRKILQNTGALRGSFTSFYDNDQAGVGAEQLLVSDIETKKQRPPDLAKIHQEGRGNVPKREMLPRRTDALNIALKVYRLEIRKIARKANR